MLLHGDSLQVLKDINNESIDLIVTDPPYGIEFMGKDWDKALPSIDIWKECFRVLKTGKLAFVMCSPRQDVLSRMIISLEDSGFRTNYTSIYWTYASGFPKAANVSKLIDKKFKIRDDFEERRKPHKLFADYLKDSRIKQNKSMKEMASLFPSVTGGLTGCVSNWENAENVPTPKQYSVLKQVLNLDDSFDEFVNNDREIIRKWEEAEREILHKRRVQRNSQSWDDKYGMLNVGEQNFDITKPATEEAKKMEGAYVGFQPKPAVEIILVVSKGKTLTWLDDCRIPFNDEKEINKMRHTITEGTKLQFKDPGNGWDRPWRYDPEMNAARKERNLNAIDTAIEKGRFPANLLVSDDVLNDGHNYKTGDINPYKTNTDNSGKEVLGYPRNAKYITSRSKGDSGSYSRYFDLDKWAQKTYPFLVVAKASKGEKNQGVSNDVKVNHPTIKPLKLFSYLITMGSRENDLILDPFCGSGTTLIAADNLARKYIGIEINKDYLEIAKHRLLPHIQQTKLDLNQYITPEIEE